MRKTILTMALAVGIALPMAAITSTPAEAYGERWYMVKKNDQIKPTPHDGGYLCSVGKGDRLERIESGMKRHDNIRWMKVRVVGDFWRAYCKGWVRIPSVYNMDTTVNNLADYARIGNRIPIFRHEHDIWSSRNEARDHGRFLRNREVYCWIPVGTKVHVFNDFFNGSANVMPVEGPCRTRGWILSYTLDRIKDPR